MNPENMGGPIGSPEEEEMGRLVEERGALNEELMQNAAGGTLSDEAIEAKQRRIEEIDAVLASRSNRE
ncbi:MAG: hypothetical protein WDZ74_00465 [Candidatus Paceibacterota bacterium]